MHFVQYLIYLDYTCRSLSFPPMNSSVPLEACRGDGIVISKVRVVASLGMKEIIVLSSPCV